MRLLNPLAWWRDGTPRPKARRTPARRPGARNPKRGARKVGARQLWQRGVIVFAAALVLAGMGWLSTSGWIQRGLERAELALLAATAEAGLMLGDVLVEGRERTGRRVVLETLGVVRGQPILAFDPYAAKARLERLPWVRSATVARRLPAARPVAKPGPDCGDRSGRRDHCRRRAQGLHAPAAGGRRGRPRSHPGFAGHAEPRARAPDQGLGGGPRARPALEPAPGRRHRRAPAGAGSGRRLGRAGPRGVLGRDVAVIDLRVPDRLVVRTTSEAVPKRAPGRGGEET
jgi:cell division protein FtsQ